MYDFLNNLMTVQLWFAVACCALSALLFPFLPAIGVHFIYRRWVLPCPFKWLRVLCICFMLAFAILGMFFILYEYLMLSEAFENGFLHQLGIS